MTRSSSAIAEPSRVSEHAQLGDVAAEEEGDRPVGDDPELPGEKWELVEVVRPRDEPADEAAERNAEDERDSLVPAERSHLPERAVPVPLGSASEVLREPACLAQCVLRGRRIRGAGRRGVRHTGAVTERPETFAAFDLQVGADPDAPALVER